MMSKAHRAPLVIEGIGLQLLLATPFLALSCWMYIFSSSRSLRVVYDYLFATVGGAFYQLFFGTPDWHATGPPFYYGEFDYSALTHFGASVAPWGAALVIVLLQFLAFGYLYAWLLKRQGTSKVEGLRFSLWASLWGRKTRYLWSAFLLNQALGFYALIYNHPIVYVFIYP